MTIGSKESNVPENKAEESAMEEKLLQDGKCSITAGIFTQILIQGISLFLEIFIRLAKI